VHELTLTGLDGENPLGFLAALGVLAALVDQGGTARLAWRYSGGWRAVIRSDAETPAALVAMLDADRLSCVDDPALALEYQGKRDLKPSPALCRQYLLELVDEARADARRSVDWAAAFASDVVTDNNGNAKPTALHFTAGQQQFLDMAVDLSTQVNSADLAEAIEGPWLYTRPLPVMGWDATSSRDYALRASNPSLDKKLGVPGADWLALRGLRFLPVFARGRRLVTSGCTGGWKNGSFSWPLWTVPLGAPVVRSLLGVEFGARTRAERTARGIAVVLSSRIKRSDQGGYGSFEPAAVVGA
jgi:hypothetical protein